MSNSNRTVNRVVAMAGATMLAMALIPARSQAANNGGEARSVMVRYHATDLDTPEGVVTLYRRIRQAAADVCSPLEGRLLEHEPLYKDCFSHAVANAVRNVHNEAFSAYHWQRIRGGKPPQTDAPVSLVEK
jgi:UrcA family protein